MRPQIVITNDYKEDEVAFIINAWLKVAANSNTHGKVVPHIFYTEMAPLVQKLLLKSKVIMARSSDDENHLYGCIVYNDKSLLFCYVKGVFRDFGLFNEMFNLIENKPIYYTIQNTYTKILKKKGLEYNPYEQYKI